ncbi:hypothetical protein G6F55_013010 [Rhizopus delemar]|uniref:Uncharacterized protein n=2 Tax=Rhizopus TaxID=4842 RepID=A0A9P7CID7_9FUNG|nr:hypothetical protein G6F55_013010 [Rhizopus delemar]KAG1493104.1 hypothetical protein G6F52_013277 [Rhizopus delemar]KAG1531254.1 hypothetical protein G6F51_013579 [Rhizopus arrhizus]KAG1555814.1 hypothetical protein G6F50_012804 [Rhizopus delemar]
MLLNTATGATVDGVVPLASTKSIAVANAKHLSWQAFCKSLESDFTKAISKVKQLKRRHQSSASFSHPDGPSKAVEVMASHLASVFDGSLLPSTRPSPPPSPSSLGLPLGLHGSSPSGSSPSGTSPSGPPDSSNSLFTPLTIHTYSSGQNWCTKMKISIASPPYACDFCGIYHLKGSLKYTL